jgi:hypothetical protein
MPYEHMLLAENKFGGIKKKLKESELNNLTILKNA